MAGDPSGSSQEEVPEGSLKVAAANRLQPSLGSRDMRPGLGCRGTSLPALAATVPVPVDPLVPVSEDERSRRPP